MGAAPLEIGRSHIDQIDHGFGGDKISHVVLDEFNLEGFDEKYPSGC